MELDITISGPIGRGAYGNVHSARFNGEDVACKLYSHVRDTSYAREASVLFALNHPNVIRLLGCGFLENTPALVFPLAERDLVQVIRDPITLISIDMVRSLMQQLLNALAHMHAVGYVHRDVKPANILVARAQGSTQLDLWLTDFSLSCPVRSAAGVPLASVMTAAATAAAPTAPPVPPGDVVTLWYRAPELLLGASTPDLAASPALDVWSAGCVLGELLSRCPLFRGHEASSRPAAVLPHQPQRTLPGAAAMSAPAGSSAAFRPGTGTQAGAGAANASGVSDASITLQPGMPVGAFSAGIKRKRSASYGVASDACLGATGPLGSGGSVIVEDSTIVPVAGAVGTDAGRSVAHQGSVGSASAPTSCHPSPVKQSRASTGGVVSGGASMVCISDDADPASDGSALRRTGRPTSTIPEDGRARAMTPVHFLGYAMPTILNGSAGSNTSGEGEAATPKHAQPSPVNETTSPARSSSAVAAASMPPPPPALPVSSSATPFQRDQTRVVFAVMGVPRPVTWPGVQSLPHYVHIAPWQELHAGFPEAGRGVLREHVQRLASWHSLGKFSPFAEAGELLMGSGGRTPLLSGGRTPSHFSALSGRTPLNLSLGRAPTPLQSALPFHAAAVARGSSTQPPTPLQPGLPGSSSNADRSMGSTPPCTGRVGPAAASESMTEDRPDGSFGAGQGTAPAGQTGQQGALYAALLSAHDSLEEALDLLDAMLNLDPAQRPTATEALAHAFFTNIGSTTAGLAISGQSPLLQARQAPKRDLPAVLI